MYCSTRPQHALDSWAGQKKSVAKHTWIKWKPFLRGSARGEGRRIKEKGNREEGQDTECAKFRGGREEPSLLHAVLGCATLGQAGTQLLGQETCSSGWWGQELIGTHCQLHKVLPQEAFILTVLLPFIIQHHQLPLVNKRSVRHAIRAGFQVFLQNVGGNSNESALSGGLEELWRASYILADLICLTAAQQTGEASDS